MKESIEQQIEGILELEGLSVQAFSQALFGPQGLFNQLAATGVDKRSIAKSPLFERANSRLSDLESEEIERLETTAAAKNRVAVNGPASRSRRTPRKR